MTQYRLTTHDNPFDPFEDFGKWFDYDAEKGYNSCGMLARISKVSDEMTEVEVQIETSRAIDDIVKYDFTDTFKKVTKEYQDTYSEE